MHSALEATEQLQYDAATKTYSYTWWGEKGRSYFIEESTDLKNWGRVDFEAHGENEKIEWKFFTEDDNVFFRLKSVDSNSPEYRGGSSGDDSGNHNKLTPSMSTLSSDTDGDGMPDDWEIAHGLNPYADDADGNLDGDSLTNLEEYINGYDPGAATEWLYWKTNYRYKYGYAYPTGFISYDYSSIISYKKETFESTLNFEASGSRNVHTQQPYNGGIKTYTLNSQYSRERDHSTTWSYLYNFPVITSRLEIPPDVKEIEDHFTGEFSDNEEVIWDSLDTETNPPWQLTKADTFTFGGSGVYDGPYTAQTGYQFPVEKTYTHDWSSHSTSSGYDSGTDTTDTVAYVSYNAPNINFIIDFEDWLHYPDWTEEQNEITPTTKYEKWTAAADPNSGYPLDITGLMEKSWELSEPVVASEVENAIVEDVNGAEWSDFLDTWGIISSANYSREGPDESLSIYSSVTEYYITLELDSGGAITWLEPRSVRWFEIYEPEEGEPQITERNVTLAANQLQSETYTLDPMNISTATSANMYLKDKGILLYMSDGEKNILVNDSDDDMDFIPAYADGYDRISGSDLDDESTGSPSNHLIMAPYGYTPSASDAITITYDASDPSAVYQEGYNLHTPPENGKMRLWKKGLNVARNAQSVAAGGDYIPPGTYTLGQLGWQSGDSYLYLAVEGVKSSDSEYDCDISVVYTPSDTNEPSADSTINTIVSQFEIYGRGVGSTDPGEYKPFPDFIYSVPFEETADYSDDLDMVVLPGAWVEHIVRIRDPRVWEIDRVIIGDESIPLHPSDDGTYLESDPFVITDTDHPAIGSRTMISPGELSELDFSFNAKGKKKFKRLEKEADDIDKKAAGAVDEAVSDMEDANWPSGVVIHPADTGAFGKAVHEAVINSSQLPASNGWYHDVWVHLTTKEVLQFGEDSVPGYLPSQVQQVDLIMTEVPGLNIGDHVPTKAVRIYDIKTAAKGRFDQSQFNRLKSFLDPSIAEDNVKYLIPMRRWTPSEGWHDHPKFKLWSAALDRLGVWGYRLAAVGGFLGIGSSLIYVHSGESEEDLMLLMSKMAWWNTKVKNGPVNEAQAAANDFWFVLSDFCEKIGASDGTRIFLNALFLEIASNPDLVIYLEEELGIGDFTPME